MRRIIIKRDLSQLTIWIDKTLHDWLKIHAKQNGKSMSQIIQDYLLDLKSKDEG